MITKTRSSSNPERDLLLAAHMARQIPGDEHVLSDELMLQVLSGERRLTRTQFNALVASPLTLCRLRYLESQRLSQQAAPTSESSGIGGTIKPWQRSEDVLLAAAGTDTNCTLHSLDGLWALHALTTGRTTRLLLQLRRPQDEEDNKVRQSLRFEPDMEVAVLDGGGGTLLMGRLDDDGELEAVWDRPLDLRSHLAQFGGVWSVERV